MSQPKNSATTGFFINSLCSSRLFRRLSGYGHHPRVASFCCLMFNVERLKWVERQIKVYADEKVFVMDCDSNVSFDGFVERW